MGHGGLLVLGSLDQTIPWRVHTGGVAGHVGNHKYRESLSKIVIPTLILKADTSPQARETYKQAVSVMQQGKLVHIDGAGHNLHHDELRRTAEEITEFFSDF